MPILRRFLYFIFGIPLFIVLVWFFAVPGDLIKEKIEEAVSNAGQGNVSASMRGFRKGLFISLYADSLDLYIDKISALEITDLSGRFDAGYLTQKRMAFSINGKIGTGSVNGLLKYPPEGEIKIDRAELDAIPYLSHLGIKCSGSLSADIHTANNNTKIVFRIPDLAVQETSLPIPFMDTFHRVQGVLSVTGNTVKIDSVSLEGDKGYARLKGAIVNKVMSLNLELMPNMDKLNTIESMLIGKYIVSPGYYVIPVKGPVIQ